MFTISFWRDAAERAIRTTAQAAVALIGTTAIGILDVDWTQLASASALAGVVSLLTSIASSAIGDKGTASLLTTKEPQQ